MPSVTTAEILLHGEKNACHKEDISGITDTNCDCELSFYKTKEKLSSFSEDSTLCHLERIIPNLSG